MSELDSIRLGFRLPTFKKPIEVGPSSNEPEFRTKDMITIFASWP